MGGRGSSSGVSDKGKKYGTEFYTVYQYKNIKYIKSLESPEAKIPYETMTKGRIYVSINERNEVKFINLYDTDNKKNIEIDIKGIPHTIDGKPVLPHVHVGYEHKNSVLRKPSLGQNKLVDIVLKEWDNYLRKK